MKTFHQIVPCSSIYLFQSEGHNRAKQPNKDRLAKAALLNSIHIGAQTTTKLMYETNAGTPHLQILL